MLIPEASTITYTNSNAPNSFSSSINQSSTSNQSSQPPTLFNPSTTTNLFSKHPKQRVITSAEERIAIRKERQTCVPMQESDFHQWMEDKAKYEGWLDSQSNQVNQSSTLTSTSNLPPTKQTYKTHPNYHKKVNKIQIG
jgi:hypothetical protein